MLYILQRITKQLFWSDIQQTAASNGIVQMAENRSFCLLEWPPGEGGALEVQQLKGTESGVSLIIGVQGITLIKEGYCLQPS